MTARWADSSLTPEKQAALALVRQGEEIDVLPSGNLTIGAEEEAEEQVRKDRENDRALKGQTHISIFKILRWQIVGVFALMLLQGFHVWGFKLDQWAFGIFLNGTLVQTYFLVRFIVEHLYPKKA